MQAYCLDLRERVVSAYENGVETILEVAERFEVSDSFIKKLLRRKRTTGGDCTNRASRRATETLVGEAPKVAAQNRVGRTGYNLRRVE